MDKEKYNMFEAAKHKARAHALVLGTGLLFLSVVNLERYRKRRRVQAKRIDCANLWERVLERRWREWISTGIVPLDIDDLHPDLRKLIVVNDMSLLQNKPPRRFEDLTPTARQALSGITPTISTITGAFLPTKQALLDSFNRTREYSELTEGGRAFTKHCHRCSKGWWGEATGPADVLNKIAEKKVLQILNEATWRNVFYLPGNFPVCEFRVPLGYGARWSWSPNEEEIAFRGFLEPPQENGHEIGWKH